MLNIVYLVYILIYINPNLKKIITKMTTPTREKEVCRALQTIFHDVDNGLSDKEAFTILNWDYKSKSELFDK